MLFTSIALFPKSARLRKRAKTIVSTFHDNAHTSGGAGDDARSMFFVAGIQVVEFSLGNILHLCGGDLETLVFAASLCLLFGVDDLAPLFLFDRDAGGLLEQHRGRRTLHLECERAIVE